MGQITLDYNDAMCVLEDPESGADARVVAACTVAFFETKEHVLEIDSSTRSIVLRLSHMVADTIFATPTSASADREGQSC